MKMLVFANRFKDGYNNTVARPELCLFVTSGKSSQNISVRVYAWHRGEEVQ